MKAEIITITAEEYKELLEDRDFLLCLYASGLDNWEGMEEAIKMYGMED